MVIPVSGTIFLILMVVGGVLWMVEISSGASRAATRDSERRARENASPPTPDPSR